jgi:hypothetical protein
MHPDLCKFLTLCEKPESVFTLESSHAICQMCQIPLHAQETGRWCVEALPLEQKGDVAVGETGRGGLKLEMAGRDGYPCRQSTFGEEGSAQRMRRSVGLKVEGPHWPVEPRGRGWMASDKLDSGTTSPVLLRPTAPTGYGPPALSTSSEREPAV